MNLGFRLKQPGLGFEWFFSDEERMSACMAGHGGHRTGWLWVVMQRGVGHL